MKAFPYLLSSVILFLSSCRSHSDFTPTNVLPSPAQLAYIDMEMVGFIHFGMNTFTNSEWGYGNEDPALFNPAALDARQWARVAKEAGMGELILTVKHHDGFCLWPSAYTDHCIKSSPYRNGEGDIVREFVDACREEGLKVGFYLSPWDRNHADYGKPAYLEYYRNQLCELLTGYGEINEIWFDGANGGSGFYGGAREERHIDRERYYDWPATFELVKKLQPGIQIFSDAGPDIRWIGNEKGYAGESFWSTIDPERLVIGASDPAYLNTGDPSGEKWITGQCDVSIRPGWFYHPEEDTLIKTSGELFDLYLKSVGRNAVLLLNMPPDPNGLIPGHDSAVLAGFGSLINESFTDNLASDCRAEASSVCRPDKAFSAFNVSDGDPATFWASGEGLDSATITLFFDQEKQINCIELNEPVKYGQRIRHFQLEIPDTAGGWQLLASGTTIGRKRIVLFDMVETNQLRLSLYSHTGSPALSAINAYHLTR